MGSGQSGNLYKRTCCITLFRAIRAVTSPTTKFSSLRRALWLLKWPFLGNRSAAACSRFSCTCRGEHNEQGIMTDRDVQKWHHPLALSSRVSTAAALLCKPLWDTAADVQAADMPKPDLSAGSSSRHIALQKGSVNATDLRQSLIKQVIAQDN